MSDQTAPRTTGTVRRRRTRAFGVAGATGAALAVWAVAAGFGVDLEVSPGGDETQPVGPGVVTLVSLGASLAGWVLLALLERLTAHGRRIWTVVAVIALALSLGGPLAGVDAAVVASLAAMHLAVGAVLIPTLARSSPQPWDAKEDAP